MRDICPFCNCESSLKVFEFEEGSWAVTCNECNATGPSAQSHQEAIDRWLAASTSFGIRGVFARLWGA